MRLLYFVLLVCLLGQLVLSTSVSESKSEKLTHSKDTSKKSSQSKAADKVLKATAAKSEVSNKGTSKKSTSAKSTAGGSKVGGKLATVILSHGKSKVNRKLSKAHSKKGSDVINHDNFLSFKDHDMPSFMKESKLIDDFDNNGGANLMHDFDYHRIRDKQVDRKHGDRREKFDRLDKRHGVVDDYEATRAYNKYDDSSDRFDKFESNKKYLNHKHHHVEKYRRHHPLPELSKKRVFRRDFRYSRNLPSPRNEHVKHPDSHSFFTDKGSQYAVVENIDQERGFLSDGAEEMNLRALGDFISSGGVNGHKLGMHGDGFLKHRDGKETYGPRFGIKDRQHY